MQGKRMPMGMFKPVMGNRSTVFTITPLHGQGWCPGQSWSGHCPSRADPCPFSSGHSLGEGIEPVGLLGLREGDSHARGEWGVEHDGSALVAGGQINRGHCADALSI